MYHIVFALSFHRLVKICPTANQCNLSFILIMVSIQLRAQDASLQIHVIQGLFPIQSSWPLSVFDDPFFAALHGLIHERNVKNSTKPKTRSLPPPPKQMRKINANRQVVRRQNVTCERPSIVYDKVTHVNLVSNEFILYKVLIIKICQEER